MRIFKRKKSYPAIVAEARKAAEETCALTIVFQQGKVFNWCYVEAYEHILIESKKPVIQLLICLPNGTVAQ